MSHATHRIVAYLRSPCHALSSPNSSRPVLEPRAPSSPPSSQTRCVLYPAYSRTCSGSGRGSAPPPHIHAHAPVSDLGADPPSFHTPVTDLGADPADQLPGFERPPDVVIGASHQTRRRGLGGALSGQGKGEGDGTEGYSKYPDSPFRATTLRSAS